MKTYHLRQGLSVDYHSRLHPKLDQWSSLGSLHTLEKFLGHKTLDHGKCLCSSQSSFSSWQHFIFEYQLCLNWVWLTFVSSWTGLRYSSQVSLTFLSSFSRTPGCCSCPHLTILRRGQLEYREWCFDHFSMVHHCWHRGSLQTHFAYVDRCHLTAFISLAVHLPRLHLGC